MKRKIITFSLGIILFLGYSMISRSAENTEIDSLLVRLDRAGNDTSRVNILLKLAEKSSYSDIKSSEEYSRQALLLAQKINYTKGVAYSKFQLASSFIDYDFKLTEELVLEALDLARQMNDSILIARLYNTIGNMKDILEEEDDALSFYNKALQIYKKFGHDSLAAGIYNNLGIVYKNLEVDSLSEIYYLKAAEINLRTENYLWLSINYLNMGNALINDAPSGNALSYFEKSYEIAKDHDFRRLFPWIFNNISGYYLKLKDYEEAKHYAEMALEIAREFTIRRQEEGALFNLKDASYGNNDLVSAFNYSEELLAVKDSINQYNNLVELDMMEMRYKFEEERKQQFLHSELLKAEIKRKELTLFLILLGSGLLAITFIFLFLGQRNRIRRKNLEQKAMMLEKESLARDLEYKNKELTTNVMYLLRKNEFIASISDKLKNTSLDMSDDTSDVLGKIISELDKSISDDSWTEFEVRFQDVHVDFYNQLSKQFPDLTPNELRLCAFLRLNMTSKEISSITYQSIESLKAARYRLRKKLGMDRDENLVAFLAQL